MINIQKSAQVFQNFLGATRENKEVVLDAGDVKAAPAKVGVLGRFVNWLTGGESTRKINVDTRQAFMASIQGAFGEEVAKLCLKELNFYPADKKPLSSREIHNVAALVSSEKALNVKNDALQKIVKNFESKDALFRSFRDGFAEKKYPNSLEIKKFGDSVGLWADLKDSTYDKVYSSNLQLKNMEKLRGGL